MGGTAPAALAADLDACRQPPPAASSESPDEGGLLEERLRGTEADVRLPTREGSAVEIGAVGEDIVLLEEVTRSEYDESTGTSERRQADLSLRRVAADGSTRWTAPVGTFVPPYRTDQRSLLVDGGRVRVLWSRADVDLPDPLAAGAPATLVVSTFGPDGALASEVELQAVPAADVDRAWMSSRSAIGSDGSVAVGSVEGDTLVVDSFDPDGRARWKDEIEGAPASAGTPRTPPVVIVLPGGDVVAAWAGSVVRWAPDGDRRWDVRLEPADLTPIHPGTGDGEADLLITMDEPRHWFCAVDADGRVTLRTVESVWGWGPAARAWWTESGLMLLTSLAGLGINDNLVVIGLDGSTRWNVPLAASGDVLPAAGSVVHDATVTDAGEVVLSALVTGYPPGASNAVDDLEQWDTLLHLAPPAGSGDLASLPTGG